MIQRHFNIKVFLLLGLLSTILVRGIGQNTPIALEEALRIARQNYAGLERDRLAVDQQNKLSESGLPFQPTALYLSGEEYGNNQLGITSFNIQQNFYLPKVARVQRAFYQQGAALAESQLILTDRQLKMHVEQAYYHLLYARQEQALIAENVALYNDFLVVTTKQLESGETGRMPQLAAQSRVGQVQLEQEHTLEKYQIALLLFNQWLQSDTTYDVKGELSDITVYTQEPSLQDNPHLLFIQAQQELASAKVETERSQLLPQINSGFKLQSVYGSFPLFGYQIGLNIPLFGKAYRGRIEAAEIGVMLQEADFEVKKQELEMGISELRYRLDHQQHILEFLRKDLTPMVDEQSKVGLKAYQEGEITYLEYLDGVEQVVKVKQQYLAALYKFNVLQVELAYWDGK